MTDTVAEIADLRQEVARLASMLAPWIGMAEMQARYGVTGRTLLDMEKRGEIPTRVRGRWLREEVMLWEKRR
jgi:hypothetical protein